MQSFREAVAAELSSYDAGDAAWVLIGACDVFFQEAAAMYVGETFAALNCLARTTTRICGACPNFFQQVPAEIRVLKTH